jgi:hypothetical protein
MMTAAGLPWLSSQRYSTCPNKYLDCADPRCRAEGVVRIVELEMMRDKLLGIDAVRLYF